MKIEDCRIGMEVKSTENDSPISYIVEAIDKKRRLLTVHVKGDCELVYTKQPIKIFYPVK